MRPEVAVGADTIRCVDQPLDSAPTALTAPPVEVSEGHLAAGELGDTADVDGTAVAVCSDADDAVPAVAERRRADDAERVLTVDLEADQGREDGVATDEVGRGVDRVDHPAGCVGIAREPILLPQDRVVGEAFGDRGSDRAFDRAVSLRDPGAVGLRLGVAAVVLAEGLRRDAVGQVGQLVREREFGRQALTHSLSAMDLGISS